MDEPLRTWVNNLWPRPPKALSVGVRDQVPPGVEAQVDFGVFGSTTSEPDTAGGLLAANSLDASTLSRLHAPPASGCRG